MRKFVGEYNECLKKMYGSLRKRFKLDYLDTLAEVDKALDDEEFLDYAVILISNDDTYSKEFIEEVNAKGEAQAFGFYREGALAYNSVQEVREMVPKLINDEAQRFVYVSVGERSYFRLPLEKTICIKQGKHEGMLSVDIIRTRPVVKNELIRSLMRDDLKEFNELLNTLYTNRWEKRADIFEKGYKFTQSEILNICNTNSSKNALVCIKDGSIVGFIIYEYTFDGDNRAFYNVPILTIKDIYVDHKYRRQGVATRMYEEVVRILGKIKSSKVKFKVWNEDEDTKKFICSLQTKPLYTIYELDI